MTADIVEKLLIKWTIKIKCYQILEYYEAPVRFWYYKL